MTMFSKIKASLIFFLVLHSTTTMCEDYNRAGTESGTDGMPSISGECNSRSCDLTECTIKDCTSSVAGPILTSNQTGEISGSIGVYPWIPQLDAVSSLGDTKKASWKYGKKTTMAIGYDDSTEGQALYGVTEMGNKGLVGTWFVNPGLATFQNQSDIWHNAYVTYGQEVANHTMFGGGGSTYEEAESVVDLANDYIKENIYQMTKVDGVLPPKILAFNKGGGSEWWTTPTTNTNSPNSEWDDFVRNNFLVERIHSSGTYKAMPFEEMKMLVLYAFGEGSNNVNYPEQSMYSRSIHFHGICNDGAADCVCTPVVSQYDSCTPTTEHYPSEAWRDWSSCILGTAYSLAGSGVQDCLEGGNGSVKRSEINRFYDWLVDPAEYPARNIWIAGYAQYRKYEAARINSVVSLVSASDSQIILDLTLANLSKDNYVNSQFPDADLSLYDESITLFTKVPETWTAARVTQNGESHVYKIYANEARYEAYPNRGQIILENAELAEVDIPYLEEPINDTYYVSLSGSDSNPGSAESPWRTIQMAVDTIKPGDRVIVGSGNYAENVVISTSGIDDDNRITVVADGAKTQGFTLNNASYITIEGFEIETPDTTAQVSGVRVNGGSHANIINNHIHDTTSNGISVFSDNIRIIGNTIDGVAQAGISFYGSYGLIEGNTITDVVEHHHKRPVEDVPGDGDDADGIRIFGNHNTIRGNRITNFADRSGIHGVLYSPHADCIQASYSGGTEVMNHTLIEGNYCQSSHESSKGIMIDSNETNPAHHIIVRNNIFEVMDGGIFGYTGVIHDFDAYNNVIRCVLKMPYRDSWYSLGIGLGDTNNNYSVKNNVVINCNTPWRGSMQTEGLSSNDHYYTNSVVNPGYGTYAVGYHFVEKSNAEMNDLFVNFVQNPRDAYMEDVNNYPEYTDAQRDLWNSAYQESDYHLVNGAPLINAGLVILPQEDPYDGVTRDQIDFDGNVRPIDPGMVDYGPFESPY